MARTPAAIFNQVSRAPTAIRYDRDCGLWRRFELTNEPIAATRQRFDKSRALRRVAEDLPDLVDGGVEIALDIHKRVRPESLLQLLPREYVSRTLQQNGQNLKRLATELQLHSGLAQLTGSKINFECLETNQIGGSGKLAPRFGHHNCSVLALWLEVCRSDPQF